MPSITITRDAVNVMCSDGLAVFYALAHLPCPERIVYDVDEDGDPVNVEQYAAWRHRARKFPFADNVVGYRFVGATKDLAAALLDAQDEVMAGPDDDEERWAWAQADARFLSRKRCDGAEALRTYFEKRVSHGGDPDAYEVDKVIAVNVERGVVEVRFPADRVRDFCGPGVDRLALLLGLPPNLATASRLRRLADEGGWFVFTGTPEDLAAALYNVNTGEVGHAPGDLSCARDDLEDAVHPGLPWRTAPASAQAVLAVLYRWRMEARAAHKAGEPWHLPHEANYGAHFEPLDRGSDTDNNEENVNND